MGQGVVGIAAMVASCVIWGLSPLYYKLLSHIPPEEVLAHRALWSLVAFGALLAVQGRLGALWSLLRRQGHWVGLAAIMISANWYLFIVSVQVGRVLEASLGYYIFPLVAVALGRIVFGERLGALQWGAVALAALAVIVLTLGLRVVPAISLVLAVSFGLYGVIKKRLEAGPVLSVAAEVLVLLPVIGAVVLIQHGGLAGPQMPGLRDLGLLVLSGPLTALPLILFSHAARRVRMATVGLVQYINPTLQFACAVALFGEVFTPWHAIAFALIWTALALYSASAYASERAAIRALRRSDNSVTN